MFYVFQIKSTVVTFVLIGSCHGLFNFVCDYFRYLLIRV